MTYYRAAEALLYDWNENSTEIKRMRRSHAFKNAIGNLSLLYFDAPAEIGSELSALFGP